MDKGTCIVEGCERSVLVPLRGWCSRCYQRWQRHGDPTIYVGPIVGDDLRRFLSYLDHDAPGSCWIWVGSRTSDGYGQFKCDGRLVETHRWAYKRLVGPIPRDRELDHFACDNPPCCNPMHVRPVTRRENALRGDTIPALHLAKTHCIHGHEFTPENTIRNRDGYRRCRECKRIEGREYQRRKRAGL